MSKRIVQLSEILSGRYFMHPTIAEGYFPAVLRMMKGNVLYAMDEDELEEADKQKRVEAATYQFNDPETGINCNVYKISELGLAVPPENAPMNSVAIIELKGAILKNDYCGSAGTKTKADILRRCYQNPNIVAVVLDVDSGGGEGSACEMMADMIKQANKPVVAHIGGYCCSAAYWITSACLEIFVSGKTSVIGSIGAYVTFYDFSKYYKKLGIDVYTLYAPQSTLKNKAYRDMLKGNSEAMLEDLREYTNFFITAVKEQRSNISADPRIFKGETFYSEEAIQLNLADKSGSIQDAIKRARQLSQSNSNSKNNSMKLFGNPFTTLSSIKGKTAAEITEEVIASLNAELEENGINTVSIVTKQSLEDVSKKVVDLEAAALKNKETITSLEEKLTNLEAADGEKPLNAGKKADEITNDPAKKAQEKFNDMPHHKAVDELIGN